MKFSAKLTKEFIDLMEELQDTLLLKGDKFKFNTFPDDDVIDYDFFKGLPIANRRKELLEKLAELKVVAIKKLAKDVDGKIPDFRYSVEINKQDFEKLLKDLKKEGGSGMSGVEYYLDSDGNFWHEPKDNFCYPMGKTSERLKILTYLVDNKGFQSPELISEHLGGKNHQTIRTEVRKIRDNFKKYLKTEDPKEIIDSKKDSGYRINPKIKVFKV